MRFALRSRRGPHVSVGQVRSFLTTLKCTLYLSIIFYYLPSLMHRYPLLLTRAHFYICICQLLFASANFYSHLSTFIHPCPLLFTSALFCSPLLFSIHLCKSKFSFCQTFGLLTFQGSMKQLRREIDRRLDYVNYVTHEPQVSY